MTTTLLYLDNFSLIDCDAHVQDFYKENDKDVLILDQTVFYPQGGGQPFDQGLIASKLAQFRVNEVRLLEEQVKHIGIMEKGKFELSELIHCSVDKERRQLHNRLHSAGHVVDLAIQELKLGWEPAKGFHFPSSPYVEYMGSLDGIDKAELITKLESLCNKFIQKDIKTELKFVNKNELAQFCAFIPDYLPENKPVRLIMFGEFAVPCGGTHVNSLSEIKAMRIRKIKVESGKIRVGYEVDRS